MYTPGVGQRDLSTGQSRFALTDALGGSRSLLGADRSPLDDQRYDAWGTTFYHGGGAPAPVPLGWGSSSGYQTDAWDSGLVLMGSRLYDTAVGRFLSPDPAGDGDNWYAYCDNDPTNASDPTGLTMQGTMGPNGFSGVNPSDLDQAISNLDDGTYDLYKTDSNGVQTFWKTVTVDVNNDLHNFDDLPVLVPPGQSLNRNIQAALSFKRMDYSVMKQIHDPAPMINHASTKTLWYLRKEGNYGDWDYKRWTHDRRYEDFGNFNAGAVAAALGFDRGLFLDVAQLLHFKSNFTLTPENPTMAAAGYDYYVNHYGSK